MDQREFCFEQERCSDRGATETGVSPAKVTGAFERYRLAVPEQQVARMLLGPATFSRRGPLSPWVVTWLMIFQRPDARGTLSAAVRRLLTAPVRGLVGWPEGARTLPLSANTSAYSQARGKLPLEVAEQVSELLFESLQQQPPRTLPGLERPVFLLDGSTILLGYSPELAGSYPPPRNQHGASHGPVMRVLVAHDVISGLAAPPCWGPMDGPQAVSEQGLAKDIMSRLPAGCGVLGDRNFGVFSMAYHAMQHPRQLSFSLAQDTIQAFLPVFAQARSDEERQKIMREMLRVFSYSMLPHRRKRRSAPREIWPRPCSFPKRKLANQGGARQGRKGVA